MAQIALKPAVEAQLSQEVRERLDRLERWGLKDAARRAQAQHGWTDSRRRSVERAYRRFLALIAIDPDTDFAMAQGPVDELWHAHLIHTQDYEAMCKEVFGVMVHHCPTTPSGRNVPGPSYSTTTLPALRRVFGVRAGSVWPAEDSMSGYAQCCKHVSL